MADSPVSDGTAVNGDHTEHAICLPQDSTDSDIDRLLPKTCKKIVRENVEVYVVGTAHFSKESQEDVGLVSQLSLLDITIDFPKYMPSNMHVGVYGFVYAFRYTV